MTEFPKSLHHCSTNKETNKKTVRSKIRSQVFGRNRDFILKFKYFQILQILINYSPLALIKNKKKILKKAHYKKNTQGLRNIGFEVSTPGLKSYGQNLWQIDFWKSPITLHPSPMTPIVYGFC